MDKKWLYLVFASALAWALAGCDSDSGSNNGNGKSNNSVKWIDIEEDGEDAKQTTATFTFEFDKDMGTAFTIDNITLSGGVIKGALTDEGNGIYRLAVSGVLKNEDIRVTLTNPAGWTISTAKEKSCPVYTFISMVSIQEGSFMMGSPDGEAGRLSGSNDAEDQHTVTLTNPFYIGMYEVTQKQWKKVMNDNNPSQTAFREDSAPVSSVSWYDAVHFCNTLSKQEGLTQVYTISGNTVTADWSANGYRLPTEAEWEYAARGGSGTPYLVYPGTSDTSKRMEYAWWYSKEKDDGDKADNKPHPVGEKKPNALGLYDMAGNVGEWCWDISGPYTGNETDPKGPADGTNRRYRGGAYSSKGVQELRSAWRGSYPPDNAPQFVGLRVVRNGL